MKIPALILVNISVLFAFCSKNNDTGNGGDVNIQTEELLDGLSNPWGMAFPSDDEILFTERSGKLWRYTHSTGEKVEISGIPAVVNQGQGGLLDIALHPQFAQNKYVYLSYSASGSGGSNTAIGRGELQGNELVNFEKIFQAEPFVNSGSHFGSRICFDDDNYLYFSVGDRGQMDWAQDSSNHCGKVMRIEDDGSVPSDNPFYNVVGAKPEIWTMGNRNIQGMAIHPETREIWAHEHGPQGGDELNKIEKGKNYGWPLVTHGQNYGGGTITPDTTHEDYVDPVYHWTPSVAPCGMTFVENFPLPSGENILMGTLAAQHLKGVKLSASDQVSGTYRYFEGIGRIRDVRYHNGRVFMLTESPGKLYEIIGSDQ